MPYDLSWYDQEHSIIRMHIHGDVTWDAWYQAVDTICEMLLSVTHRVDLLFDDHVGMPSGNPMPHLQTTMKKLNEYKNMGLAVTASDKRMSTFIRVIVDMAARFTQSDLEEGCFVSSLDEGLILIQNHRRENPSYANSLDAQT